MSTRYIAWYWSVWTLGWLRICINEGRESDNLQLVRSSSSGVCESAEEKHSTSASWASDVTKKTPRTGQIYQRVPLSR